MGHRGPLGRGRSFSINIRATIGTAAPPPMPTSNKLDTQTHTLSHLLGGHEARLSPELHPVRLDRVYPGRDEKGHFRVAPAVALVRMKSCARPTTIGGDGGGTGGELAIFWLVRLFPIGAPSVGVIWRGPRPLRSSACWCACRARVCARFCKACGGAQPLLLLFAACCHYQPETGCGGPPDSLFHEHTHKHTLRSG